MRQPKIRFKGFNDEWKTSQIKSLLKIKSGKSQKKIEDKDGKYPILATGGVIGRTDTFIYNKESVLIGRKGTINRPQYMNKPFWTVDTLFYSVIKSRNDGKFIFDLFRTINWLKYNTSTGVPSLTSSNIESIVVSYPSPAEQAKIGEFFNHFDKLIELQSSKLEHLKRLKKGYLQKMFTSDGVNVPRLRFKGFSDKWNTKELNDIANRDDNNRVPITRAKRENGNIPYFGANGVQDYVNGYTHYGHYVLIAEDGANSISNYPIHNVVGKIWVNNHAHVLSGKYGILNTNFLASKMKTINLKKYLTGNGRYKLNANVMMSIRIKLPSVAEQTKIGKFFNHLDKLIELQSSKLEYLKRIKKAYLQKMFI